MSGCTLLSASARNLNGCWVNAIDHSIGQELGVQLHEANLKFNSAFRGTKTLSEVLGNLYKLSDGDAVEWPAKRKARCVRKMSAV